MCLKLALSTVISAALMVAAVAQAETLRFASQSDVQSLDPYAYNETSALAFLGNIYEGLVQRGPDLKIEPALATRFEMIEPTRWRFNLREGVTFHNKNHFNADDVLFSVERVRKEGSNLKNVLAGVEQVVKVDDYTVDFVTSQPNPILPGELEVFYIMDNEWSEKHGATNPSGDYAVLHANGTGPFKVVSREPDVRTVAERFEGWWGDATHNLTQVIFLPIGSDATRVAAFLSGEVDLIEPVPIQDQSRIERSQGTRLLTGPELRVIFLGMDQTRDELRDSNIKGSNPLKDRRVRQAFYQAIDIDTIRRVVMRGQSIPVATLVGPDVQGFPKGLERYPYDPAAARRLLAEAGYPNGFGITMDCPNDRYINDEAICQAVVGMLGRVGVKVSLLAQTKSKFFAKVMAQGGYDTTLYLLGWTTGSIDSWNALYALAHTRDPNRGAGTFNLGGYSNPDVDRLIDQILVETDLAKRNELIYQAWQILHDEVAYIPLHQQALSWGVRDDLQLVPRRDNRIVWRFMTKKGS